MPSHSTRTLPLSLRKILRTPNIDTPEPHSPDFNQPLSDHQPQTCFIPSPSPHLVSHLLIKEHTCFKPRICPCFSDVENQLSKVPTYLRTSSPLPRNEFSHLGTPAPHAEVTSPRRETCHLHRLCPAPLVPKDRRDQKFGCSDHLRRATHFHLTSMISDRDVVWRGGT
jgi:hypothetical protein